MVTGENGPNGPPAPKPVELELIQDPGNVTRLLLLMEAKNVKKKTGKQRSVTTNSAQVIDYNR